MMVPLQIRRILCPTDFSVFSSRAFRHALALAHQFRASLKVVHVLPLVPSAGGGPFVPTPSLVLPEQRRFAEDDLRRFVEPACGSSVEVTTELRDGEPWREILAAAREMPADLVTLGTHGRAGFERFVLGSVTTKLLGRLPCPALTVCHEEGRTWEAPGLLKRVLCATDFSDPAREAIGLSLDLAKKTGCDVTLLHVIDALPNADRRAEASFPEIGPLRRALEEDARPRLLAAIPADRPTEGRVKGRLVLGRPWEKILEVAAEERADLIVLGTRGHTTLGRMIFGSTSEHVVREATCPVVTVPPPAATGILAHRATETAVGAPRAR
jgi:nucleotide-binding universal stress UspA family protein